MMLTPANSSGLYNKGDSLVKWKYDSFPLYSLDQIFITRVAAQGQTSKIRL
jgi:hypothetical protein